MKKYMVLFPSDDTKIKEYVTFWIKEEGGSISLKLLEEKMVEKFGYFSPYYYIESEISDIDMPSRLYEVCAGKVRLLYLH